MQLAIKIIAIILLVIAGVPTAMSLWGSKPDIVMIFIGGLICTQSILILYAGKKNN